jgi:hypothetical protein
MPRLYTNAASWFLAQPPVWALMLCRKVVPRRSWGAVSGVPPESGSRSARYCVGDSVPASTPGGVKVGGSAAPDVLVVASRGCANVVGGLGAVVVADALPCWASWTNSARTAATPASSVPTPTSSSGLTVRRRGARGPSGPPPPFPVASESRAVSSGMRRPPQQQLRAGERYRAPHIGHLTHSYQIDSSGCFTPLRLAIRVYRMLLERIGKEGRWCIRLATHPWRT